MLNYTLNPNYCGLPEPEDAQLHQRGDVDGHGDGAAASCHGLESRV